MKHIDTHVHFRDWDESYKYTIRKGMKLAKSHGIVAVCDMPNTKPSIITPELARKRLRTAEVQGCLGGYYIYLGATSSADQLRSAFAEIKQNPKVVGMKLYAGRSTGDLSVVDEEGQRKVYRIAKEERYTGIIAVHCEDESLACYGCWEPEKPFTWNLAKPPSMEVKGVANQIAFARQEGFNGNLHICHTSTAAAVELVNDAKTQMSITCAVTPHHLTYSTYDMQCSSATRLKVNPPIKDVDEMFMLRALLRAGKIDWIETDHAPHSLEEKTYMAGKPKESYMSGIRSMDGYGDFIKMLKENEFTNQQIEELTYSNIKKVYTKITE